MGDWHSKVSALIWKEKVIGSRYLLYLHQRAGHGTDEIACGLLPTMRANLTGDITEKRAADKNPNLESVLSRQLLRTLSASDSDRGVHPCPDKKAGKHSLVTELSLLPILTAQSYGTNQGGAAGRTGKVRPSLDTLIPTLTSRDHKSEKCSPETFDRNSRPLSATLGTFTGYKLSPSFAEWFMGFPIGWTELETYPPNPRKKQRQANSTELKRSETP
jgi:hypothetical protein